MPADTHLDREHTRGWVNIRSLGGNGDDRTVNSAGPLQDAIDAAPVGGVVFAPPGCYRLDHSSLPIRIAKSLRLVGGGAWTAQFHANADGGGTIFLVDGDTAPGTDVFLVQPQAGQTIAPIFEGFSITPEFGSPARYGIHLDGSLGEVFGAIFRHLQINLLGSFAIRGDGSGLAQGTPVLSTIEQCMLEGGISLPNAGDTVRIVNNRISDRGAALDVAFQPGSSTLILRGNNISSDGGVHIGGAAIAAQIVENEIETMATFTGSNGAVLDIDGAAGSRAVDVIVCRNSFQVVNGIVADCLRVNFSDRALIGGNRFGRGAAGSRDVVITANALDTVVEPNIWPSGSPLSSMISDLGGRTVALFKQPLSGGWSFLGPIFRGGEEVSGDRGDSSVVLTVGSDVPIQRWATTLSANQTITLSTAGATGGEHFRIVRTGLGAFTLNVGPGLKIIPAGTAAFVDVSFDGGAWRLTGYGPL